jgi:hypothetical protein
MRPVLLLFEKAIQLPANTIRWSFVIVIFQWYWPRNSAIDCNLKQTNAVYPAWLLCYFKSPCLTRLLPELG